MRSTNDRSQSAKATYCVIPASAGHSKQGINHGDQKKICVCRQRTEDSPGLHVLQWGMHVLTHLSKLSAHDTKSESSWEVRTTGDKDMSVGVHHVRQTSHPGGDGNAQGISVRSSPSCSSAYHCSKKSPGEKRVTLGMNLSCSFRIQNTFSGWQTHHDHGRPVGRNYFGQDV